jgi:hypothetical protein
VNPLNPTGKAESKPPTLQHKAAVWESMLGTVCAANREGVSKYFDYDYEAAIKYADIKGADLRVSRYTKRVRRTGITNGSYLWPEGPRRGQLVLWAKRPE